MYPKASSLLESSGVHWQNTTFHTPGAKQKLNKTKKKHAKKKQNIIKQKKKKKKTNKKKTKQNKTKKKTHTHKKSVAQYPSILDNQRGFLFLMIHFVVSMYPKMIPQPSKNTNQIPEGTL